MQALLEICIFRNNKANWWNYVYFYSKTCLRNLEEVNNEECSERIMKEMDLDVELIQKCVKDSFAGADFELDDNKLLREEQALFHDQGIQTWPWLIVNGAHFIGDLTLPTKLSDDGKELFDSMHYSPLQMICSAFITDSLPEICRERIIGYMDQDKIVTSSSKYPIRRSTTASP